MAIQSVQSLCCLFSVFSIMQVDTKRTFTVFANITYDKINERIRIDESIAKMGADREYYDVYTFFKDVNMQALCL